MQKTFRTFFVAISAILTFAAGMPAQAAENPNQAREFIMSCTYGVMAGTLVGAASLAFVDRPGENLQRVARGASLGLYTGIFLGWYTVYYLPKQLQREEEERLDPDRQSRFGHDFSVYPIVADANTYGVGLGLSF